MSDGMYMNTKGVTDLMAILAGSGRTLGSQWQASNNTILANEHGIGSDELGKAIQGAYSGPSAAIRAAADPLPTEIVTNADIGVQCAADYRAAEGKASSALQSVPSGGQGGRIRAVE